MRGAVAFVVVGMALDLAGLHRQHRCRSIECLDLGLLIDREHDRPLGRSQIQANHIADLGHEVGIGAELERLDPVRLQVRLGPDALYGRDADAGPRREPSRTPVGSPLRRWLQREGDDPIPSSPVIGRFAARPGRIGQTGHAFSLKPPAPEQHSHPVDAELRRYPFVRNPIGCGEHDPGSHREALLSRSCSQEGSERSPLGLADLQRRRWMIRHAPNRHCERPNCLACCAPGH